MPDLTTPPLLLLLAALGGYLLGSIPSGMVLARLMGLGNLREIGSGNIGATNVLRTGNKMAALLTLVFDIGKGALAVRIAGGIAGGLGGVDMAELAGLFAFLGHLFPLWLGFRGGKGVATFLGVMLALGLPAGLATAATWLVLAVIFRISSVAALGAAALAPLWLWLLGPPAAVALAALLAILIWLRHKDNIARLIAGTETRIGKSEQNK